MHQLKEIGKIDLINKTQLYVVNRNFKCYGTECKRMEKIYFANISYKNRTAILI